MKKVTPKSIRFIPAALGLAFCLLAQHAQAGISYWDPQGTVTTPNSCNGTCWYTGNLAQTWENSEWSTASGGVASPVAWTEGNLPVFAVHSGTGTPAFTVTMNANHTCGGIYNGISASDSACPSVTIQGSGTITLGSGLQGFYGYSGNGNLTIAVPMTDAGGANACTYTAEGPGQFYLNAANSYTGGTLLGYSGSSWTGIINFNNSASFGTGGICISNTSTAIAALVVEGSSAITIPNNVTNTTGAKVNILGNTAGVTFSGEWDLTNTATIGCGNVAGNLVIISGPIKGPGGLTKFHLGTLRLSNANNTYAGTTTITNLGSYGAGVLQQGVANAIPYGSGKGNIAINAGCTFDLGGYSCNLNGFGTSSSGTIDNTGANAVTLTVGNNAGGGTHSGVIKNTGGALTLVKTGTGTTTLSGTTSTYTGTTTINGGYLYISADASLGAAPGSAVANQLTLNSGIPSTGLRFNAAGITLAANRGIYLGANGGCIHAASGDTGIILGVISGPGNIQFGGNITTGVGTNELEAANTYLGSTTIAAGRLVLGPGGSLPSGTPLAIASDSTTPANGIGSIFDLGGQSQTIGTLTSSAGVGGTGDDTPAIMFNGGALTINENANSTFGGIFVDGSSAGSLTLNGPGALTLSGTSTYTGPTTINTGGNLVGLTDGGGCANSTVTISDGATNSVAVTNSTLQWTLGG